MAIPYTPRFLQPDPDGSLSNSLTPTTKTRYMNSRGSADPCGQARFTATRVGSVGVASQTPQTVWDSGWLGAPTVTALPLGLRQFGVAEFNGRIYITGGKDNAGNILSSVYSAPLQGGSIGSWRAERPLVVWPLGPSASGATTDAPRYGHACCAATFGNSGAPGTVKGAGGTSWLICYSGDTPSGPDGAMIAATILGDGTLGPWQTISLTNSQLVFATLTPVPNQYSTTALVLGGGATVLWAAQQNWWVTPIRNAPANSPSWDTPVGWWGPQLPLLKMAGHTTRYDWAQGHLITARGADGTTSQLGEYSIALNIDTLNWSGITNGAGWLACASGGAGAVAQNQAGAIYFGCPQKGVTTSYMYLFGGNSSPLLPPPPASAVNTVAIGTYNWNATGDLATASWVASARPLPAAAYGVGTAVAAQLPITRSGWGPFTDNNFSRIYTLGGGNGSTAALSSTQSSTLPPIGNGSDLTAWTSGTGGGLVGADLGTGGTVVASPAGDAPAGSQDITNIYGNAGGAAGALANGDQVQLTVCFSDKVSGDPSSIRSSILRIGAAPTVTNIAVATTATGQPLISWAVNGGIGGQAQATWRCVVTVTAGGAVMFDSGVMLGQANQVQVKVAPVLSNVSHTATITVTSSDNPVTGATATATNTLVWTPTTAAAPGIPTGFNVVPDATNFWDLATWTNLVNTTSNRIYHRRNGTSAWTLLLEYTAGAGAQAIKLMDKIPLGVGLDFAISAMGGTTASESALSSVVSNVVLPAATASPSGYLHLAGQAPTGAIGAYVNAQVQPTMSANYASKVFTVFNGSRAVVRQGPLDYRKLDIELLTTALTAQKGLQTLVDALLAGGVAYWRGRNGGEMFPVALDSPQEIATLYPSYRDFKLHLVEVADVYAPYVASGSAVGIPTLIYGSIPPLDISERVA